LLRSSQNALSTFLISTFGLGFFRALRYGLLLSRFTSLRAGLRREEGFFLSSFRGAEAPLFHPA